MVTDPTTVDAITASGPASWAAAAGLIAISVTAIANLIVAVMAERRRAADVRTQQEAANAVERKRAAEAEAAKVAAEAADAERVAASKKASDDAEKAQAAAVEAAKHAREVRDALAASTTATDKKLDHVIVVASETKAGVDVVRISTNSVLGKALHVAAVALRRVADDHGDPGDATAADIAEADYRDHMTAQAGVDAAAKIATVSTK